jgi:vacuolar-type H+-ATPase subunit H
MASRIEEIIEEIEEYIGDCKFQPFSNTKIIVDKDEMEELLSELKARTPEEIRKYQKIISNKEAILADAQAKADSIIAEATAETNELVSEHQIMQQAYAQANEIVNAATKQAQELTDNATRQANEIQTSSIQYTDDMLKAMEDILANGINHAQSDYDALMSNLQKCMDVVQEDRRQLQPQPEEEPAPEDYQQQDAADASSREKGISTI